MHGTSEWVGRSVSNPSGFRSAPVSRACRVLCAVCAVFRLPATRVTQPTSRLVPLLMLEKH